MVACLSIPGFSLRAPLLRRPELRGKPVALAPVPGARPLIGSCTRAAHEAGVRPGMRLSEALAMCPQLKLVEQDPAGIEEAWEAVLRRLEEAGFAVEPAEPGCVYFETRGVERLAGGLGQALRRALEAVGEEWG
ncbi:MAG: DNA polymerase Y family protein, partial [Gaiellaceae bacterium]